MSSAGRRRTKYIMMMMINVKVMFCRLSLVGLKEIMNGGLYHIVNYILPNSDMWYDDHIVC